MEYNLNEQQQNEVDILRYITAFQAAEKWNISQRRVQVLCVQGRIPDVFKLGTNWAIPENTEKPEDARKKRTNENNEKQTNIN